MEEVKLSTRSLLVWAVLALVILLAGPLGYKLSLVPLQPSIVSLLIAVAGGLLVFVVGLIYLVIAIRKRQSRDRNLVIVAMILGLMPAAMIGPQMLKAREVPQIHDITTDTSNPPAFVALKDVRKNAPNGSEYGSELMPAEALAVLTLEAYPGVQPLVSDLSVADAVARSRATLEAMGLEIVAVNPDEGRVEATATTFWFGFKDDVIVRVLAEGEGSRIDLRSMSRVGRSDIGANAARILAFREHF